MNLAIENFWHAIENRDRRFDGAFVFAVSTTSIYCRPSCPSKHPNKRNVRFFAIPEAARQAGFRACLRCKPDEAETPDPRAELTRRICAHIENHLDQASGEPLTLKALGRELSVSPFHLQRTFKRVLGISPHEYAEALRMRRFKSELKGGQTVTNAMYEAGFGSSSRLYEHAPAHLGMTPTAYQKGAPGTLIRYAIAQSPLGRLLVAATSKGICGVSLGDSDSAVLASLRNEYPEAKLERDDAQLDHSVRQILQHLNGRQANLDLPLDIQATAFQRLVWNELRKIPYGETRTYSQIAAAIGNPAAVRAVARACATNPTALVIPCHRVVRADKSSSGYRWGKERKQQLLAQEQSKNR